MRFSVHIPTAAEGLAHPIPFASAEDLLAIALHAEQYGYSGVWGNHHVTTQNYVRDKFSAPPSYYDPLITLAAIAAVTDKLELGTAVVVPGFFSPAVLAKQVATLDVISGGRFRLGLGIGAYPEEHQAVWPDRRVHRGRAFDESVTVLRDLFQERSVTFDGEFVKVRGVESYPKPLQSPLPMYFGGHTLRAVERAAAWGQGWMPGWQPLPELRRRIEYLWRCLDESGRPRSAVEVAPQLSVTIAKTDSEAMDAYWASGLVQHRLSLAYTGRDLSQQAEANLVGSPSTIRAKVRALAELGVQHGCALWFTAETVQGMLDQMEWFAHDVMEGRHDLI